MMANRLPWAGGAVPIMRAPMSSALSPWGIGAGDRSVHQISVETVPGAGYFALDAGESISTLATKASSCPVTTRRIAGYSGFWSLMGDPLF